MFCTNCGAQHPDGTRFCTACGCSLSAPPAPIPEEKTVPEAVNAPVEEVILPQAEPAGKVCAVCGASLPEGRKFCTACGSPVGTPAPAPAAQPVPAEEAPMEPAAPVIPEAPVISPVIIPEAPVMESTASVSGKICAACGASLPDDTKFCTTCGTPVSAPAPAPAAQPVPAEEAPIEPAAPVEEILPPAGQVCAVCGTSLPEGRKFCTVCGTAVGAVSFVPAAETPAAPVSRKEKKNKDGKSGKKTWKIVLLAVLAVAIIAGGAVGVFFFLRESSYNDAQDLIKEKNYDAAIVKLEKLDGYKDSDDIIEELNEKKKDYNEAKALIEDQEYYDAAELLEELGSYADAKDILANLEDNMEAYDTAQELLYDMDFEGAQAAFAALGDFSDSAEMAEYGVTYQKAQYISDCAYYADPSGYELLYPGQSNDLSDCEEYFISSTLYVEAAQIYREIADYMDADSCANDCIYQAAVCEIDAGCFDNISYFIELADEETAESIKELYDSSCADVTVWDDIEYTLDFFTDDSTDEEYMAALDNQIETLAFYREANFSNEKLKEYVITYLDNLDKERETMDETGAITNWPKWYKYISNQYAALSRIAETLELDEETAVDYANLCSIYSAKSAIEEVLTARFNGELKADGSGEDIYYFDVENTTKYGFVLNYRVTWYKDEEMISETDVLQIEVPIGETVSVSLKYPGSNAEDYIINWDCDQITIDGKLLPGQD